VESILLTICDNSMASVGAAVEAGAKVEVLGKDVDKLAFALIAPLGTKDDSEFGLESVDALGAITTNAGWEAFAH
jgi:hypothetical protein